MYVCVYVYMYRWITELSVFCTFKFAFLLIGLDIIYWYNIAISMTLSRLLVRNKLNLLEFLISDVKEKASCLLQ